MNKSATKSVFALLMMLSVPVLQAGDVYKWQDENGHWNYSDRPPDKQADFDVIQTPAEPRRMVSARQGGVQGRPEHFFYNRYHGKAEIQLEMSEASNVKAHPSLPAQFVLPADSERALVRFSALDPTLPFTYRLSYRMVPGAPMTRLPPDPDFYPPFARGSQFPISQGLDDSHTHKDRPNQYAVDIGMPTGTPVLAARSGVVMDFEDNFHGEGQQTRAFMNRANYVRIEHDDGSMAVYAHLQADSARVSPGMRVPAGHWIANSGNSGYSSGPHLHFVVQINTGMSLESLPFRFKLPTGGTMDPDRAQMLAGVLARPTR